MSVYSMTGYASAQRSPAATPSGQTPARLGLEIRSVNGRFLDLTLRLPDELRSSEPALRELVASHLKRGKVELRAFIETSDADGLAEPGPEMLERLAALQAGVLAKLTEARPLGVSDVLRLAANQRGSGTDWAEVLQELAAEVLAALVQARAREGARLADMLLGHIAKLRELTAQAQPLVPQLVEQQRQRFLERWKEAMNLGEGASAQMPESAQERALTEATAYAIRIDVAEELTRLASHLDEIERLLKKGGEVGKRLDFLIQELHREANTLGSKSAMLELTRISVDMKVLIEQMREQVQNLE